MTNIDELSGPALSVAVAEAMGEPNEWDDDLGECFLLVDLGEPEGVCPCELWHPHDDANQALEVLAVMPAPYYVESQHGGTWFARGGNAEYASGTFCEAICRAFLKAKEWEG